MTLTLQSIPLPRNYEPSPNAKPGTNRYTWFQLDFLVPYVVSGRIDGLEYKALVLIGAQLAEQGQKRVPIPPAHFVFALRKCWRTCSTVLHRLSKKGFVRMDRFEEGDGRCWTYGWKPGAFDRNRIQCLELIPMQTKPQKSKVDPDGFGQEDKALLDACVVEPTEPMHLTIATSGLSLSNF